MTIVLMSITGVTVMWGVISMNPIKVSVSVLITSSIMFFFMSYSTGLVWFPMILLMLFMGGIIMMFMILSSILPNEKSMKMKNTLMVILFMILMSTLSSSYSTEESVSFNSKTYLMCGMNFFLMMTIVLFYFLVSMSIISSEQTPMRSITWH